MPATMNLVGQHFGYLQVMSLAASMTGRRAWTCRCDCGCYISVCTGDLRRGHTSSCGCARRKIASSIGKRNKRHGMHGSPEYRAWANMIDRCENPKHRAYKYWGGRGIFVCAGWRASFEDFFAHMGPRPSSLHSLDRYPNNDGNYEPGNCRWATKKQQVDNRRKLSDRMIAA